MARHLIPGSRLLPSYREPERTHDVSGRCPLSSRDHGGISLKQWAAGAPVIGAAPVSSGKPKRPRVEGLPASGALQLKVLSRSKPGRDLRGRVPKERNEKETCRTLQAFSRTIAWPILQENTVWPQGSYYFASHFSRFRFWASVASARISSCHFFGSSPRVSGMRINRSRRETRIVT
jgi:hypothetical protein